MLHINACFCLFFIICDVFFFVFCFVHFTALLVLLFRMETCKPWVKRDHKTYWLTYSIFCGSKKEIKILLNILCNAFNVNVLEILIVEWGLKKNNNYVTMKSCIWLVDTWNRNSLKLRKTHNIYIGLNDFKIPI